MVALCALPYHGFGWDEGTPRSLVAAVTKFVDDKAEGGKSL